MSQEHEMTTGFNFKIDIKSDIPEGDIGNEIRLSLIQ